MSKQYPGGLITKTPVTPAGPYQDGSAPGIWTLNQAAYWAKQGLWPTAGNVPTDPYFPYVTMLLHGDGTNGAQNNTFLDSSTNNFTITRNGNTTQGTFTPYGSNWSNYFDGSGDYLTAPNNTAFDLSTSNFTIEGFFFPTVGSTLQSIFAYASNAGASISDYAFQLLLNSSNGINFRVVASGSSSFTTISTSNTFTLNSWNYVCVTRTGTSVSVYLNGTTTTGTIASTIRNNASSILTIGRDPDGSFAITGYLSNLRILKGTAVTPSTPTAPLTAITNTSLLTCQSNRFIDNSTNNFTITKNGDVSVQRFSPFSPTTAYSTSVIGGSSYMDGSGDYLSVADANALDFGTSDFTIEMWVYARSIANSPMLYDKTAGNLADAGWFVELASTGGVYFGFGTTGGTPYILFTSSAISINNWFHLAVTRVGSTLTCYVNGTQLTPQTLTNAGNAHDNTSAVWVGNWKGSTGFEFNGYLTDVRAVKGTAVYTTTFTPPTAPLTAITNTSLLLSYTNAGILDNAMMNDLETVGNAQVSTSVKKYGTGSMYFDGSGDYLDSTGGTVNALGSGNWTIEFWVYFNSLSGTNIIDYRSASVLSNTLAVNYSSGMQLYVNNSTTAIQGSALSTATWYHIAVCKSGSSTKMFVNGTQAGSTYTDTNNYVAGVNRPRIGSGGDVAGNYFSGYIDDLRITKGYARYTASFTPPTSAFPNQ
jgi:hypothetical protein